MTWRFIRRKQDLIITDWRRWWKEISSKIYENRNFGSRNGNCERNAVVKNPGDKTAWTKNSWILLAMGSQRAVFWKETIAVSSTMSISVEKWHSRIRLRVLSCGRMSENHREPEVPEEKVPVVECLDGLARITSKELAITHFVKSGTLQNACSTRPRVVVGLGRSAHTHIVRLMNSRLKGPKRMMTKVQWLYWRRVIGMNEDLLPANVHDRSGKPDKRSDEKLGQKSSKRRSSNARQLGCVFQDMTPPKSILRKSTDMRKLIQRVKFTKAIARHTKIRDQNPSLGYICPGNLMNVAPTLQNLRIGLKRRQSGKSKVPAKQRGSWPKVC